MSDILYKKKSLRFSGCGLSKAVRLKEHSENGESSRSELLNARRNICHDVDDSLISEPEPPKEKAAAVKTIPKPLSRLEQLRKWKEEKAFKKKLELENKRKVPFVVGKAKPVIGSSVMNSSTVFGAKNTSRLIFSKDTSSLNVLKSTNRITPKVNLPASSVTKPLTKNATLPASSLAKPLARNVNLPAPSVAKPLTKNVTAVSIGQKTKPQSTVTAASTTVKDKPQAKTGIPKSFVSRLPSRNLPQVNQSTKTFDSRIPACKPSIQQKKDVKENQPLGKTDGKRNPPTHIGKIDRKGISPAPPAIKNEKRNFDSKFLKPLPGMLPKPITSKNTVKNPAENKKSAAEKKIEPRRKSFAPENFNFKFASSLSVLDLDLSVFEGIDFSRKTSTPLKETPVPSPQIARINSDTGSKHLLSDISKCINEDDNKNTTTELEADKNEDTVSVSDNVENEKKETVNIEIESRSVNSVTELETKTTDDTVALPNIALEEEKGAENVVQHNPDETVVHDEIKVKISEPEKNEASSADEHKNEVGAKNITRRSKKLDRNSKVLEEIIETEFDSLLDVKPPELLCNPRLCSIKEELECSLEATPCSNGSGPRRSLRLAKLAQNETPVKVEKPGPFTDSADLSEAFNQLQMSSTKFSEEEFEPQLPVKEMKPKKVSLLYTPPNSRYSLRKSVRGDLISFS